MSLSSNTIIHFTKNRESLESILTENFRVKYCKETIKWHVGKSVIHVPMVSFCDIPLSQIKTHISSYGNYGIGLSREWAAKNKLNPVLYVEPTSSLAENYEKMVKHFGKQKKATPSDANTEARRRVADIARYIKNYQGTLTRNGVTIENYRFSDEREWRFVPGIESACKMLYVASDFETSKAEAIASLSEMRLNFEPEDIKYIIIKDDSEINGFVSHLRHAKGSNFTMSVVEKLTTRILTSEQIKTDF